jgi:protein-S-isoprenylcysteine O-methyltransferase Ste14
MVTILAHLASLALLWIVWLWLANQELAAAIHLGIAVAGAVLVVPLAVIGRRLLNRQPDVAHARRVTSAMHYLLALFFGCSLISAVRLGQSSSRWPVPLPPWLGLAVMALAGIAWLAVIFVLVVRGMGIPFAVGLTREVVTDWIYAWTRNPMVLSALAFLFGLGLWLGSALFLVWLLVVFTPAALMVTTVYEERELEIRFGPDYQAYRERTPRFIPRRPTGPA